jgi:hypothetical protein
MTSRVLPLSLLVLTGSLLSPSTGLAAELPCDRLLSASATEILTAAHPDITERRFVDGVSCSSESGDPKGCDWEGRILDDRVLEREPGSERRLILFYDNHRTGSGGWGYVTVFMCALDHVIPVFRESFLYGPDKVETTSGTIVITAGYWDANDPTCCPSKRKRQVHQWDPARHVYVLQSTTYMPLEK